MQGDRRQISKAARIAIDRSELFISPMVVLEMEYLFELNRTKLPWRDVESKLRDELEFKVCKLPFESVSRAALDEKWTRDPFDRIIVAQARARGLADLISTDKIVARHYPHTIW